MIDCTQSIIKFLFCQEVFCTSSLRGGSPKLTNVMVLGVYCYVFWLCYVFGCLCYTTHRCKSLIHKQCYMLRFFREKYENLPSSGRLTKCDSNPICAKAKIFPPHSFFNYFITLLQYIYFSIFFPFQPLYLLDSLMLRHCPKKRNKWPFFCNKAKKRNKAKPLLS